jgi:inhibitor of KinA
MTPPQDPLPRLRLLGDAAWVVEMGSTIDEATHARVMGLAQALALQQAQGLWPEVLEWVPAYTTLTVHFHVAGDADPLPAAAAPLLQLARSAPAQQQPGRRWRLPVCFDADHGPDLPALAQARGMSVEAAQALLTGAVFRVYMLGFQPGFPYMGGLPAALEMPRRSNPRTAVPERSVAVAGRMCAVYPWRSPGGWHLVGRTPLHLFDASIEAATRPSRQAPIDALNPSPHTEAPAWLQAGDEVQWFGISREQFNAIEARNAQHGVVRSQWLAAGSGAW